MRTDDKLHVVQLLPRHLAMIGKRMSPRATEHQDMLLDRDVSIEKRNTWSRNISRRSAVDRIRRSGKVPVLGLAKYDMTRLRRMHVINVAASVFKLSHSGSLSLNTKVPQWSWGDVRRP